MNRVVNLTDEWDQNTSRASQQQMVSAADGHQDEQEHNQAKKNFSIFFQILRRNRLFDTHW